LKLEKSIAGLIFMNNSVVNDKVALVLQKSIH